MANIQKIVPQIFFIICSFIALGISFFVIGLSNFTWLEWLCVGLASFGVVGNSLVIYGTVKNA